MARREQVFWGWGEPGAGPSLPDHAPAWLQERLGVSGEVVARPVALADVRLRPPALPPGLRVRLADLVGENQVRDDREARVLRARGKSYLDLLDARSGALEDAPDAVVAPGSHEEVLAVLRACNERAVAVVPFGGGTSVVGGVHPARGGLEGVVSLDTGRLDALIDVDDRSLVARLQPGIRLPEADRALAARGLRLGHHPQSYEWATVGGAVATRSAGQASTGLGRIDANLVAVRLAAPVGDAATREVPRSAAGPALRELLAGSEGAFGVLTEVALRVRPLAAAERYEGWFVSSFEEGCALLRELAQEGALPDVARLSDVEETAVGLALAGTRGVTGAAVRAVRRARPCLLVCGWEGPSEPAMARRRTPAVRRLRDLRAVPGGRAAGAAWRASRYAGPYLRDDLLDRGVLVETLETAATWDRLPLALDAIRRALAPLGGVVGCHVSHVYATGASLYCTVLAAQDRADPAGQWRAAKLAATEALLEAGGTLTHHHGVGADHAPWLAVEDSPLGVDLLRAVKERLDPAGIMNPGKLLAAPPRSAGDAPNDA